MNKSVHGGSWKVSFTLWKPDIGTNFETPDTTSGRGKFIN